MKAPFTTEQQPTARTEQSKSQSSMTERRSCAYYPSTSSKIPVVNNNSKTKTATLAKRSIAHYPANSVLVMGSSMTSSSNNNTPMVVSNPSTTSSTSSSEEDGRGVFIETSRILPIVSSLSGMNYSSEEYTDPVLLPPTQEDLDRRFAMELQRQEAIDANNQRRISAHTQQKAKAALASPRGGRPHHQMSSY